MVCDLLIDVSVFDVEKLVVLFVVLWLGRLK